MTAEPRDVAAPPDALARIFPARGEAGYWATTTAQINAAHRRGDRMLLTQTDSQGQRWIRKLTEYTHLADHLALAKPCFTSRWRWTASEPNSTKSDSRTTCPPTKAPSRRPAGEWPPTPRATHYPSQRDDVPADAGLSQQRPDIGSRSLPDPDDALAAITEIFERGTRHYRDADTTMLGLQELWDRLGGEDKQLLATYEVASHNHGAHRALATECVAATSRLITVTDATVDTDSTNLD